jgi:hypothetical protein
VNTRLNESQRKAPICRWLVDDFLDLMPCRPMLQFSALAIAGIVQLWRIHRAPELATTKSASLPWPYFLATKLEAFRGRGKNDFRNHDLEDVVTIIDGRTEFVDEVVLDPAELRRYLSDEFQKLLSNRDFLDALPGHLLPDAASQRRLGQVVNRMRKMELEG